MWHGKILSLLLLTVLTTARAKEVVVDKDQTCRSSTDGTCSGAAAVAPNKCSLYMAESTIPGAGVGTFTAYSKNEGDTIGTGDVCLPLIDSNWHLNPNTDGYYNPFQEYFWNGAAMGMLRESDGEDVQAHCAGLDSAINCHLGLVNVQKAVPVYDEGNLHRRKDPGVGAFTPYHNGTTLASRYIPAGSELFKFYGDQWFQRREHLFGLIPLSDDYIDAEELLRKLKSFNKTSAAVQEELYKFLLDLRPNLTSSILNAFPDTFQEALAAAQNDLAAVFQPKHTRSLEWLEEHGRCLDNIVAKPSEIQQAGRGAFATRPLKKGSIVATSPLIHASTDFVQKYNITKIDGKWIRLLDDSAGQQVLVNYCFGHERSSLLLCPYGAGVNYINHRSSEPNIAIQWAEGFVAHNQTALEKLSLAEIKQMSKPLFAFDFVALRDIEPGQELYLDYGSHWFDAWGQHFKNYKPYGDHPERYASGEYWNRHFGDSILRTEDEQEYDPYPDHLQIRCHHLLKKGPQNVTWYPKDYGFPCRVLDRFMENGTVLYTIELEIKREYEKPVGKKKKKEEPKVTWMQQTDIPRSGMAFFDVPGTTDLHLPNAFRHSIGIPDDILPDHWRDIPEEEDDDEEEWL